MQFNSYAFIFGPTGCPDRVSLAGPPQLPIGVPLAGSIRREVARFQPTFLFFSLPGIFGSIWRASPYWCGLSARVSQRDCELEPVSAEVQRKQQTDRLDARQPR